VINISRPIDEYALKIVVTKLTLNRPMADDQFELKVPAGVAVQHME
jgi:outer membrane lipoprotein-sorting protein